MAKSQKKKSKSARHADRERGHGDTERSLHRLEQRIETLHDEHRALNRRLKKLTRRLAAPPRPPWPPGMPGMEGMAGMAGPMRPPGPPWRGKRRGGPPPWVRGLGPVISLEVPLETNDPAAPLWATVSARLPEEITTVGDDGRVERYRYSAVGSTPQAPRYRHVVPPGPDGVPPFPD